MNTPLLELYFASCKTGVHLFKIIYIRIRLETP